MVRLALWLTVLIYSLSLIGSRIGFQISAPMMKSEALKNFDRSVAEGVAKRRAATKTNSTTAPAEDDNADEPVGAININLDPAKLRPAATRSAADAPPVMSERGQQKVQKMRNFFVGLNAAKFWAFTCFFSVMFGHLIPCLFIPWTFRESLRPAAAMLAVNAGIMCTDLAMRQITVWPWMLAAVIPLLGILPGSTWCWWRERRFHKQFRTSFESKSFRKLQHDLSDARRVHEALLPAARSRGPVRFHYVYEPMRQIGGDLLFVFPPSHQHQDDGVPSLSLVVLDVTGHGIAAALTVNRIVGELERLFIDDADTPPGKVLAALNRYVFSTLSKHDHYVTAICLRVDSARNTLEFANGGHPTAFLRRADGSIELLESTAPLLGILDQKEYDPEPATLAFNFGDAVVAYTDGAAEARNHTGKQLGIAGIKQLLAKVAGEGRTPPDWPGEVMRQVLEYRGAPPDDDTLIATIFRPR
jgi:serine phosphatase RsbU (regulator of sigma subunit)